MPQMSFEEFSELDPACTASYLREQNYLDDTISQIFLKQDINGHALLCLTEEELTRKPGLFELTHEQAKKLAELIKKFNEERNWEKIARSEDIVHGLLRCGIRVNDSQATKLKEAGITGEDLLFKESEYFSNLELGNLMTQVKEARKRAEKWKIQIAFHHGLVHKNDEVMYGKEHLTRLSKRNGLVYLVYCGQIYLSFNQFMIAHLEKEKDKKELPGSHQREKFFIGNKSYMTLMKKVDVLNANLVEKKMDSLSGVISLQEASQSSTSDHLLTDITTYFTSRGFQPNLVSSFLKSMGDIINYETNEYLLLEFLQERELQNPLLYVGIEEVESVKAGEDMKLLVEYGLTEKAASALRNSVCDDLWTRQILKHWLIDWIHDPWFNQAAIEKDFHNQSFPRNEWLNYESECGPVIYASSFEDIAANMDNLLSNNAKVANSDKPANVHKAFYHATTYESAQNIMKHGIKFGQCELDRDFGPLAFYLNPSLDHAIEWIKKRKNKYLGIVVYWVDMEKVRNTRYRDLVTESDDMWRKVVVASRHGNETVVDDADFVHGYQLANVRDVMKVDEGQAISIARWFEPTRQLQLAAKTFRAANLLNDCCIGVISFYNPE